MDIKKLKKIRLFLLKKESLDWWNSLPLRDDTPNCWSSYCKKYYPGLFYFYLNDEQIFNVYINEKVRK
ncbi:MAG: hypothetical protein ACOC2W_02910 [bacterium]